MKEVSFDFSFIILQGKKQTRFVECGDVDIKKLVENVIPESAKKSTKYERTSMSRNGLHFFYGCIRRVRVGELVYNKLHGTF